jgi:hypothetical protein
MKTAMKLLAAVALVATFVSMTGCLDHATGPCGDHRQNLDRDTTNTQSEPVE